MSFKDVHARRLERERARRARVRRRRAAAAGTLFVVALVAAGIAIAAGGGASPTRASHAASSKPSAGAHGSGPGKPVVITFDNGYSSQYTNALPVLKRLGWTGVENIQLLGLPPSEGGLTDQQVRGLLAAGWELDTQGMTHADLIRLDAAGLQY